MEYIFFGAGKNSKRYVRILNELLGGDYLRCFVDNYVAGTTMCGKQVIDFQELKRIYRDYTVLVTVSKIEFVAEITNQLQSAGIPFVIFDERYCFYLLKDKIQKNPEYYQKYKIELDYMLHTGRIEMIPYPCKDEKFCQSMDVSYVEKDELYCCNYLGKMLFFPKFQDKTPDESVDIIRTMVHNLLKEQDPASPHRYFTPQHSIVDEDIFVDIGAAEAMTSLAVVEKVNKVYIFEGEAKWKKALQATFAPYGEKVVIIDKFVGDHDIGDIIKIDTFFQEIKGKLFIKVDIEGNERSFLHGAEKTLQRPGTKISLCTYHYPSDAEEFVSLFQNWGYKCELSPGWLFVWGDFARGMMYGQLASNEAV